jgi:hypothetical protein
MRPKPASELEGEPQRVPRRGPDLAVVRRLVRVGRVDVDLLEAHETARVVDELDRVVLVFARLQPELHEALHAAGLEVIVVAQPDHGLGAREAAHQIAHPLDDVVDLVDRGLVLGELADRAFAAVDASRHRVDVVERALQIHARLVDPGPSCP